MSTVAKIFVVLNFLLAATFLGSAAAFLGHSDNWKARYTKDTNDLKAQISERDKLNAELNADKTKLSSAKTQAEEERKVARQEADTLKTAYDQMKKSYDELNASLSNQSKALQVAQATIQNGRALVDELQKERQTLIDNLTKANDEKVSAQKMQNQLELNLDQANQQLQDLQSKLATSETSLQRTTFELEAIKRANPGIGAGTEQPWQTAKVLAADNAANIVVISLGSEDGVKGGFRYTLSRGSQYVATIEITNVQAKQAAGRVLTGMSKMPVAAGDDAMTAR